MCLANSKAKWFPAPILLLHLLSRRNSCPTYINPKLIMETTVLKKIWLSPPHMGGNEEAYVKEAFETNWIAPLGPNVQQFEKSIEDFIGNNVHSAGLSSGTAAIHLGLELLGVGHGDEVICQSFTFAASANPITYLGATPIFVAKKTAFSFVFWSLQSRAPPPDVVIILFPLKDRIPMSPKLPQLNP